MIWQVLTEYVVQDLNTNPVLPFQDNTFDVITNVVSVDYLTKPLEVFREMNRVLKPGGLAVMR
jgi:ubiquinone/menaquinone biosynthesis C-methylase UbiE